MMTMLEKINGWHPVIISIIALGVGMTDINEALKGIIYVITICYLIWKWMHEYKKSKKKEK